MKKLLISLIAGVGAAIAVAAPALANGYHQWGDYVGNIWISQWTITDNGWDTTAWLDVSMPTCSSHTQLMGDVVVDYYSDDGGYMTNYRISAYGLEGHVGWIGVTAYDVVLENSGTIYVTDETYCGPLDVSIPGDSWPWPIF